MVAGLGLGPAAPSLLQGRCQSLLLGCLYLMQPPAALPVSIRMARLPDMLLPASPVCAAHGMAV
jgi:ABC-type spermidine/putrescine transport system permease subunit I